MSSCLVYWFHHENRSADFADGADEILIERDGIMCCSYQAFICGLVLAAVTGWAGLKPAATVGASFIPDSVSLRLGGETVFVPCDDFREFRHARRWVAGVFRL